MHVPDEEISPKRVDISYVIIGLCLFSIYLLAGRELNTVDQTIVPRGDAFSYSTFLFEILNRSRESFGSALQYVVESGNFIWLQHFLVLAFAPFLANQRGSLIFINYFAFFVAIIIVFRTALLCRVPHFWAFAIALLFASMPWNFHALMQFNLTSLMPEPIFVDAFLCSILLLCWFISNPYSKGTAIATGFALGAAIWSRGNAFMYLAMPLAGFAFTATLRFVWPKRRLNVQIASGFAVVALTSSAMAAVYFYFTHHSIYEYYLNHATSVQFDYARKLVGAKWILPNMPGLAISGQWYPPDLGGTPFYALALTVLAHLVVIYSAIAGVKKLISGDESQIMIGALGTIGAATFYLYTLFALLTFSGYYSEVQIRILHPFEPALVGFICCALAVLCELFSKHKMPRLQHKLFYIAAGSLFVLSAIAITQSSFGSIMDAKAWGVYGFKRPSNTNVSPCLQRNELSRTYLASEDISRFSLLLSQQATNKLVYFFWYGIFNHAIVENYAAKNNVRPPTLVPLRSEADDRFWFWTFNSELVASESSVREYLKYVLAKADFVVIPERLDAFQIMWPSPMTAYREDIAAALNSPDIAADYHVWAIIDERPDTRVFVLKKLDSKAPDDGLEPFPRTWGTPAQVIGRDFKGARVVAQKAWWEADANALPQLLYAYGDYNVIRVGQAYIGAAHDLGPMDVNPVLTGAAPRPPLEKFIVARDTSILKEAIDACTEATSNHRP